MSKTELVEFVAAKAGLTKADALRALDAVLDDIEQVQVRQQRAIIEQREGKENNSQNIGD